MDRIFQKHNSARHYCMQRLEAQGQSYAWQARIPASIYWRALREIESFVPDDFASLSELQSYLDLAVQTALREALSATAHDFAHELRRPLVTLVDIQQLQQAAADELLSFIRQPPLPTLPPLPYRRVLTKLEATAIWAAFEERRQALPKATCYDYLDDRAKSALLQHMADHGKTRLYNLFPMSYFAYELDVSWLTRMFCYDDTYWTPLDFSWYIYGEGHGYPVIGGFALEIIRQ